jgi:thioredoxin 1
MANVTPVSEQDFEGQVLKSLQPVLVDFWAPWCGPCRMIAPIIEQLATENHDQIKVVKINVDESPGIAATYGVNSIPTLMIFKNGDVVDRFVGVQPKTRLQSALSEAMA